MGPMLLTRLAREAAKTRPSPGILRARAWAMIRSWATAVRLTRHLPGATRRSRRPSRSPPQSAAATAGRPAALSAGGVARWARTASPGGVPVTSAARAPESPRRRPGPRAARGSSRRPARLPVGRGAPRGGPTRRETARPDLGADRAGPGAPPAACATACGGSGGNRSSARRNVDADAGCGVHRDRGSSIVSAPTCTVTSSPAHSSGTE